MKTCFGLLMAALFLTAGVASAEYDSVVAWYAENGPGAPPVADFGDLLGSWAPAVSGSIIGIAYDNMNNSVWFSQEGSGGLTFEIDAGPGHAILRVIDVLSFGFTGDGNTDGVAIDYANNRILLTDYQGDLNISDDILYSVDYNSLTLLDHWDVDGAGNNNPNANMNTVIGICVDGEGGTFVSTNDGLIHKVNLMAGNQWSQDFQQAVPGGGSWAGIDYDPCLNEFFTSNFTTNRAQYHDLLTNPPLDSFAGFSTVAGVASNENGILYVSGFGDNIAYEFEGIPCEPTATEETTWGAMKSMYK